ncbi:MAG: mobile mystery protein B [Rhodobacteraceae bacterium]|nr:mobile mystery protein B [Paracoccaceae bacterium]
MNDLFEESRDTTPLEPEEHEGLLPTWITYRGELNEMEQTNVAAGAAWARRQHRRDVLTVDFISELHRRMFNNVWAWAGKFRQTERNIGIDPAQISVQVHTALTDTRYWVDHQTCPPDEIAVRLHHRLVAIHPFPNGNGRAARLVADLLAARLGREPFTWGRASLINVSETRTRYVAALRAADDYDIRPLLAFARS